MNEQLPSIPAQSTSPTKVEIVDLDIPFIQMVFLLVKWSIAAIPAAIILFFVAAMLMAVLGGLFGLTR